jgi:hypothetical protein
MTFTVDRLAQFIAKLQRRSRGLSGSPSGTQQTGWDWST